MQSYIDNLEPRRDRRVNKHVAEHLNIHPSICVLLIQGRVVVTAGWTTYSSSSWRILSAPRLDRLCSHSSELWVCPGVSSQALQRQAPRRILIRCLNHLSWLLFDMKAQLLILSSPACKSRDLFTHEHIDQYLLCIYVLITMANRFTETVGGSKLPVV